MLEYLIRDLNRRLTTNFIISKKRPIRCNLHFRFGKHTRTSPINCLHCKSPLPRNLAPETDIFIPLAENPFFPPRDTELFQHRFGMLCCDSSLLNESLPQILNEKPHTNRERYSADRNINNAVTNPFLYTPPHWTLQFCLDKLSLYLTRPHETIRRLRCPPRIALRQAMSSYLNANKLNTKANIYDTHYIGSLPYDTPTIQPPSPICYPSDITFTLYHNDTMIGHISIMTHFNTTISWICESAYLSLPSHVKDTLSLDTDKTYISITGIDLYYDRGTNLGSFLHWHSCHPPIFLSTTTRFGSTHSTNYADTNIVNLTLNPLHYPYRFGMNEGKTDPWNKKDPWGPWESKYLPSKPEPDLTPPPTSSASSYIDKTWNNINNDHQSPWTHPTNTDKTAKHPKPPGKAHRSGPDKPYTKKLHIPINEYTPTDPFCYMDNTSEIVPFSKSENILRGFQAVSIIKRPDLDEKMKLAADDTNSFALFVGGNNPHFLKHIILPPHTILEMTMPATHPKDLNALLQGYLISFGPRVIIPMTRTPDTILSPSLTIEHYTWVTQDHPDAALLKLHPHSTWSSMITTQYGIPIPQPDIFNPRLAEGKLTVTIRTKKDTAHTFHQLSGPYGIFSTLKHRSDETRAVTMVWMKGPLSEILERSKKQSGFEGIVPSTSPHSFGVRIDSMYIEEARRSLTDITKFHPTNANTSHRYTYETKGWPKTTDPYAAIEVFHAWGWSALIISKKDGGQRSTFTVGSQVPPPCGILYLAEGAIILNEILKHDYLTITPLQVKELPVIPITFTTPPNFNLPTGISTMVETHTSHAIETARAALTTDYNTFATQMQTQMTLVQQQLQHKFLQLDKQRESDLISLNASREADAAQRLQEMTQLKQDTQALRAELNTQNLMRTEETKLLRNEHLTLRHEGQTQTAMLTELQNNLAMLIGRIPVPDSLQVPPPQNETRESPARKLHKGSSHMSDG